MRELYSSEYVEKYVKLKKRQMVVYFILLATAVLLIGAIMLIYAMEPYQTKLRIPLMILMCLIAVSFITYTFLFFQFIHGKVVHYYNFLIYTVCTKRVVDKVTVLNVFHDTVDKNGVDCTRMVVLEWSDSQNDYVEHTIYVDNEVVVDDVSEGDIVTIATNSSYLLAYKKETV